MRGASVAVSRCAPGRSLPGRCAIVAVQRRSAAGLSTGQWLRTLPQAFWRGEAAKIEGAVPGSPFLRDAYVQGLVESLVPAAELQELVEVAESQHKEEHAALEGIKCAFMDRFIMDSLQQRMRQVVLLGSGMDCRVFRLELPPTMRFIEVDEEAVHETKLRALEGTGARARCVVHRQSVSLDGGISSADLVEAIEPVLNASKAALFVIDGAAAWPPDARSAALEAAAKLAGPGSVIVGPAPPHDVAPALKEAGFGQVNIINHHQLAKIYRREVPEGVAMIVAIHGPPGREGPGSTGTKSGGAGGAATSRSKATEITF